MKNEYIKYILIITLLLILSGINIIINDKIIENITSPNDCDNLNNLFIEYNNSLKGLLTTIYTDLDTLFEFGNRGFAYYDNDNDICRLFYRLAIIDSKCSNHCFNSSNNHISEYDNTYLSATNSKLVIKSKTNAMFTNLNRVIINYKNTLNSINTDLKSLLLEHNGIVNDYNNLINKMNKINLNNNRSLITHLQTISTEPFIYSYNPICIKSNYIERSKNAVKNSKPTYNSITSAILDENVNYFRGAQDITCNNCIEYINKSESIDKKLIEYIENIEQETTKINLYARTLHVKISFILTKYKIFIQNNNCTPDKIENLVEPTELNDYFNNYKELTNSIIREKSYLEKNLNRADKYITAINNIYNNITYVIKDEESNHNFNIIDGFFDTLLVPDIFKMQYPSTKNIFTTT